MNRYKFLILIFSVFLISACTDDDKELTPEPEVQFFITDVVPDATNVSFTAWAETKNVDLQGERGFIFKVKSSEELTMETGEVVLQPLLSTESTVFGITNNLAPEIEYELRGFIKDGTTGEVFYSDVVSFTTLMLVEISFEITELTATGMTATGTMINRSAAQGLDILEMRFLVDRITPTPLHSEFQIEDITWDEYRTYTFTFTRTSMYSSGSHYMLTPKAEIDGVNYFGPSHSFMTP